MKSPLSSKNVSGAALASVHSGGQPDVTPSVSSSSDPYTHAGHLVVDDPLRDNSQHMNWMEGENDNAASCDFVNQTYQSTQPLDGFFHACLALATDFSDFVYETQMTIMSGDSGGIIFRANQSDSTFYYFRVGQDGSYDLRLYVDAFIDYSRLLVGRTSLAINRGPNNPNLVAVVANGASLELYVNHQLLISLKDSTFSHGQIGVASYDQGGFARVAYNNAKVWAL